MKKTKVGQAGFSFIEPLLIIVLLAIIGFVGYYVYHANNKATDTYNDASATSATPVISSKKTASKPAATSTPNSSANNSSLDSSLNSADPSNSQNTQDMTDANGAVEAN